MQADEETGEDTTYVCRHKADNEVVAPFTGKKVLQPVPERPYPAVFGVDFHNVAGNEVLRAAEGVQVFAIGREERRRGCVTCGLYYDQRLAFGVVLHGVRRLVGGDFDRSSEEAGLSFQER